MKILPIVICVILKKINMENYQLQIIETLIVILVFIVIQYFNNHQINDTLKKFNFQRDRRKLTVKSVNFFMAVIGIIILIGIWGVKQGELLFFITSLLTVFGIAVFAQWSILSNITSGIILFFNHPLKIGDTIKLVDKEQPVEGVVQDISYFFLHLKTVNNEIMTIPNSVVIQKVIIIITDEKNKLENFEK